MHGEVELRNVVVNGGLDDGVRRVEVSMGENAIIAYGTLYVSATNCSGNGEVVAYGLP